MKMSLPSLATDRLQAARRLRVCRRGLLESVNHCFCFNMSASQKENYARRHFKVVFVVNGKGRYRLAKDNFRALAKRSDDIQLYFIFIFIF